MGCVKKRILRLLRRKKVAGAGCTRCLWRLSSGEIRAFFFSGDPHDVHFTGFFLLSRHATRLKRPTLGPSSLSFTARTLSSTCQKAHHHLGYRISLTSRQDHAHSIQQASLASLACAVPASSAWKLDEGTRIGVRRVGEGSTRFGFISQLDCESVRED